jgi:hypothetical protein
MIQQGDYNPYLLPKCFAPTAIRTSGTISRCSGFSFFFLSLLEWLFSIVKFIFASLRTIIGRTLLSDIVFLKANQGNFSK